MKNFNEDQISNGGKHSIDFSKPYQIKVIIQGTADYLFHRYNCEAVEEKGRAKKGSAAKKTDDLETFVYRNEDGYLCVTGEQLRMAIISSAKYKQDPRSPRKSAMDLYKAGVVSLTHFSSLGKKNWDYEDKRRVVIQRSGITRIRPAIKSGWRAEFDFQILLPEYICENNFLDTITTAGKLCGIGDFRPTYGRFSVVEFKII